MGGKHHCEPALSVFIALLIPLTLGDSLSHKAMMDFMSVGQSSSPSKTRSKHSFGLHIESDLLTITGSSKSRDVKQLTFGVKKSHQMFSGKSERDSHEGNVCEGWGPGLTPWPGPNECQFRISSSKHSLKSVDYT